MGGKADVGNGFGQAGCLYRTDASIHLERMDASVYPILVVALSKLVVIKILIKLKDTATGL